jgi:hypothetical protein
MSADTEVIETPEAMDDISAEFADIPGYDTAAVAKDAYENSSADSIDEFRRAELVKYLLNETIVAFDSVADSQRYPGDGLITINDAGSMAAVRIDEAWADCLDSLFDNQCSLDDDFPRSNPGKREDSPTGGLRMTDSALQATETCDVCGSSTRPTERQRFQVELTDRSSASIAAYRLQLCQYCWDDVLQRLDVLE